jgi:hypothetical protein
MKNKTDTQFSFFSVALSLSVIPYQVTIMEIIFPFP